MTTTAATDLARQDDVTWRSLRLMGWFGLAGVVLFACELPLWILPGDPPLISDAAGHSAFLAKIRVIALTRILLDMGMYACFMVFFSGLRLLIVKTRAEYEWLGTLIFGAGVAWWTVILAANALQGGAVVDTIAGTANPTAVRALVEGTLFSYNGPVGLAAQAVFMASSGCAILVTGALPRWMGWAAWTSVALCLTAIPAVFVDVVDHTRFYNVAGWGPGIVTTFPPMVGFAVTSIFMIRKRRKAGDEDQDEELEGDREEALHAR